MSVPSETLDDMNIRTIPSLVALAAALGAEETGDLSAAEQRLLDEQDQDAAPAAELVLRASSLIRRGEDPLGDAYCAIRSPGERRPLGQTYTPHPIIEAMLRWASDHGTPTRVVDPGAGSGRYLLAAGRRFPEAELHGSDVDPLATLMLRANLAAAGLAGRARIHLGDYRALALPEAEGPTLFIGNPPYVRHHQIAPEWKAWLLQTARRHGLHASALAGLHVHFFLATAEYGRRGDFGAFITSSEWLDVNYGALVRRLLLDELGGQSLHVLAPEAQPFSDATTTGAITCFRIGDTVPAMKVRRVESVSDLGRLAKGRSVSRQRLTETNRWSVLTRVTPALPEGHVELGELCRVHRGTVTGANAVWVRRDAHPDLPERVLFPSITRARELFGAGARLGSLDALRRVVDLPVDLDVFDAAERRQIDRFLREARARGVPEGYIASNRRAWWSVGLRAAAPILATYMARRPPAFVRNDAGARHINIAHGLYPREEMTDAVLDRLADHLRAAVTLAQGRTYAGGLVKFEPREMERIPVPGPDMLTEGA
ncbi:N-6 DNA methylase [Actinomyces massiliensis]|jgi:modification methylase xamI|uniref:site-specific DNA-methyltransferase (adenine-specific) n=1 Tax=Actinomyces massiliensis F0489 TaxID=1125718 RepID=J0WH13_9ACTO|nr:N-6 DNA methylase [Actinomyces massiliensis]EJF35856.1 methyltransferase domain protein [Actinomyces massiliensis F0489]WLD71811.1 N-6 DNA methylase [Actinomyces massiliensis]